MSPHFQILKVRTIYVSTKNIYIQTYFRVVLCGWKDGLKKRYHPKEAGTLILVSAATAT